MAKLGRHGYWFLVELERRGKKHLGTEYTRALVSEMEGHIDAAIHARMECGASAEQADEDAVRVLGHPRALIAKVVQQRGSWFDRRVMFVMALCHLYGGMAVAFALYFSSSYWDVVLPGALMLLLLYVSMRAVRVQALPAVLMALPSTLVCALILSTTMVADTFGVGSHRLHRSLTQKARQSYREQSLDAMAKLRAFAKARETYLSKGETANPLAPRIFSPDMTFSLHPVSSQAVALAAWDRAYENIKSRANGQILTGEQQAKAYKEMLSRPYLLNAAYLLPEAAEIALAFAAAAGALNLVGWLAGVLARVGRRSLRGRRT